VPIEQISLNLPNTATTTAASVPALWEGVAAQTQAWLARQALPARDAVLLLPFAALLAPARAAFAAAGGWQPRIETPLTLAASLGPPALPEPGQCSGDVALDRMNAGNLLRRLPWGAAWAQRDAAGFAKVTSDVVQAAQGLRDAAHAKAPAARDAFWTTLRDTLGPANTSVTGPAATETLLLRVAVEWACAAAAPITDHCFGLRPSAWVVLRMGGPEPVSEALMAHADAPALHLWADAEDASPFAHTAAQAQLQRLRCDDFEAEAQASAAAVIDALNAGQTPIALVALDRELVRRVRALLDRSGVPIVDETGWLLATTQAAAKLVALLKAAAPQAGADARLDWLKTWPAALEAAGSSSALLDTLEALWRGSRHLGDLAGAQALWARAQAYLRPLSAPAVRPLGQWLLVLQQSLAAEGAGSTWGADAAGAQVIAALFRAPAPAWHAATNELRLDLAGFTAWVQSCLEETPFLPTPDPGAELVLTPLARCFGRPFKAVVVPGADHLHLGAGDPPAALVGEALATTLGMDNQATRRLRQRHALAQLLRAPQVSLLHRLRDGDEPLAESPAVQWLLLERGKATAKVVAKIDASPGSASDKKASDNVPEQAGPRPLEDRLRIWSPQLQTVPAQPVARPLPTAVGALPQVLSATQVEALRQCPYRFFARAVLRLEQAEELDLGLAKRDYGTWLHAVLFRFHQGRQHHRQDAGKQADKQAAKDADALRAAADLETQALDMDAGELLPYRASFEHFVPAYLAWLAPREAQGWTWHEGEADHQVQPPPLLGLRLRGRIDRVDAGPKGARQVLDYKTGQASSLKTKLRDPAEDTQLAFYAALLLGTQHDGRDLSAAYLALDDPKAPLEVAHPKVHESALALIDGLADEWPRLQAGAPLPALGEGAVCKTCEARGLCRRDQWSTA
jgi:ATP-dependent helicase/nuclease subunit B